MALTPYEAGQIRMLVERDREIILTAERIMDGETSPELTLLNIKYSHEISEYIRKKNLKAQFRFRK
jgi:hypothetical protein